MFNLIRMHFYRLFHSKITYITVLFIIAMGIFSIYMTDSDIQLMREGISAATDGTDVVGITISEEEAEAISFGISAIPDEDWASGSIEIGSLLSVEVKSGLVLILIAIFTSTFAGAEERHGYIKNIAGLFPRREKLIFAKAVVIAVQILIMMLLFMATIVVTGLFFWGNDLFLDSAAALVRLVAVQYLLHLGFAMVIMFLCQLTKSRALSMTAGILISTGFLVPVCSLINKIVSELASGSDFDLNLYTIYGNLALTEAGSTHDILLRASIVGAGFTIGAVLLSAIAMKKTDIR